MKSSISNKILQLLGAFSLIGSSAFVVAEPTTLTFNRWIPPTHFLQTDVYDPWAKDIESATDGRVKIEFTASSLAPPNRQLDLIRKGIVDIGFSAHGYTPDRFTTSRGVELSFLGRTAEAMSVAYWRTYQEYFKASEEYRGVKLLSLHTNPPNQIYTTKGPLSSLEDLQGLKLRIVTPLNAQTLEAVQAVPVQAPSTQSYELLSGGIIDGTFLTADAISQFNLTKFITNELIADGGFSNTTFFLAMNPKSWSKISEQDQELIMSLSGEAFAKRVGAAWDRQRDTGQEILKEKGVASQRLSAEDTETLKKLVVEQAEQEWFSDVAKMGVDGKEALKMLRHEVSQYEAN